MLNSTNLAKERTSRRLRSWLRSVPALLLLAMVLPAGAAGLGFRIEGETVRELSREELAKALPLKTLTVENPTTAKATAYQGADLAELLNLAFGDRWKSYDLVKFVSLDGYQPVVPRNVLTAHRGLVAYKEPGRDGMSPFPRSQGEAIDPSPYFLVWENIEDAGAKTESWLSWPWQLTAIELTRLDREFPRTAPPAGAPEDAKRGFTSFLQHCVKCHRVNGEGGDIGPELNYPASVTEYWQPDWLAKFIADPPSVRHNSKMVGFYPGVRNREAIIRDILSYLKAMTNRKIAPEK
jgi:mono/diheme cytochrome c family protein